MLGAARWVLVFALDAGWLLPSMAFAIVPQVHDNGKFFDADTVKKADALPTIQKIQEGYKKDVVVLTYDKIPEDVFKHINYDPKNREAFFDQWARHEAQQGKVNGIIILISKDQKHKDSTWIQEDVGEYTEENAFRPADRKALHNIFENNWAKNRNEALVEALQFIDQRMGYEHQKVSSAKAGVAAGGTGPVHTAPLPGHHDNGGSNILGWVCVGLFALVVVWVIFGVIRAFTRSAGGG